MVAAVDSIRKMAAGSVSIGTARLAASSRKIPAHSALLEPGRARPARAADPPEALEHADQRCSRGNIESVRIHSDPAGGALLRTASGAVQAFFWVLAGRGPSVADNIVLTMRFHPVGGEDVSVVCEDFAGEREALEAVARALDERRGLVLTRARYDR